jgi:hypothetical protein
MFQLDTTLLDEARPIFEKATQLVWIIGGAGSGKTTVSRALADRTGIPHYDMDEAMFGRFQFDPTRHPATTAWFSAADPLGFMLGLPWPEFDALYRASNAEMLDQLAADLRGRPDGPLLLDGGISHPSVLAQVMPAARIICLEGPPGHGTQQWTTAESRAGMKAAILTLPDGEALWARFLEYDRRMTATMGCESRAAGIAMIEWAEATTVEELSRRVAEALRLG